jgi:hypothetical protein
MPFENIQIQLVDMPPMDPGTYEPWMGGIVRQADIVMLIADLSTDEMLDGVESVLTLLARISHQFSAAAADPGMSTALRSVGFLDVLSSTPAESSRRAPCSHARLRRLATKHGEKCGRGAIRLVGSPSAVGSLIREVYERRRNSRCNVTGV